MRILNNLLFAFILLMSSDAYTELTIQITQGIDNPTPIAIVPFAGVASLPENITDIVTADLRRSGLFRPIPVTDMLSFPQREADIFYRDWRILGAEYLVIGRIDPVENRYRLSYQLFDVLGQRRLLSKTIEHSISGLRDMAHSASDTVYEEITGIPGAFSTKILYIEAQRTRGPKQYQLMVADADGARPDTLLASSEPILSPAWSSDGQQVAYVSFETSRPAVYKMNLATRAREQLTNFRGLNGAPAWSPDGRRLALVLSKDGNPEIYVLDLSSRKLNRITNHFAIDTEPNWTSDGKAIIFTSNRGGSPQIYQVGLASGRVERLTFEGDYNARPRISPDGKTLAMVHRHRGVFHIATQDLVSGDMRVLTKTRLDESPSIAPNGAMLLYATQYNNKGVLAAVSMDAGVKFRLPSKQGDVREPAWSPYLSR